MPLTLSPVGDIGARLWNLVMLLGLGAIRAVTCVYDIAMAIWAIKLELAMMALGWLFAMGFAYIQSGMMTAASALYEKFFYYTLEFVVQFILMPVRMILETIQPLWNLAFEYIAIGYRVILSFIIELLTDPRTTQLLDDIFNIISYMFVDSAVYAQDAAQMFGEALVDVVFLAIDLVVLIVQFLTLTVGAWDVFYPEASDSSEAWSAWGDRIGEWFGEMFRLVWGVIEYILWEILELLLDFVFTLWDQVVAVFNCVVNLGDCICNPGNYFDGAARGSLFDLICPDSTIGTTEAVFTAQSTIKAVSDYARARAGANGTVPALDTFTVWSSALINRAVPVSPNATCAVLNRVHVTEHTTQLAPLDQLTYAGCAAAYYAGLDALNVTRYDDPAAVPAVPLTTHAAIAVAADVAHSAAGGLYALARDMVAHETGLRKQIDIAAHTEYPLAKSSTARGRAAAVVRKQFAARANSTASPIAATLLHTLGARLAWQIEAKADPAAHLEWLTARANTAGALGNALGALGERVGLLAHSVVQVRGDLPGALRSLSAATAANTSLHTLEARRALWTVLAAAAVQRSGDLYTHARAMWNASRASASSTAWPMTMTTPQSATRAAVVPSSLRPQFTAPANTGKENGNLNDIVVSVIEGVLGLFSPGFTWQPANATSGLMQFLTNPQEQHLLHDTPDGPRWLWWSTEHYGATFYLKTLLGGCDEYMLKPDTQYDPVTQQPVPNPDHYYGYKLYSLQCLPRYRKDTFEWITPLPTSVFPQHLEIFRDLCTTQAIADDAVCTRYASCRWDLGFYDGVDNIAFLLEWASNGTITDWLRTNTGVRNVAAFFGVRDYMDVPLDNFDFGGTLGGGATTGQWGCFLYTCFQILLLWPSIIIPLIVLRNGFSLLTELLQLMWNVVSPNPAIKLNRKIRVMNGVLDDLRKENDKRKQRTNAAAMRVRTEFPPVDVGDLVLTQQRPMGLGEPVPELLLSAGKKGQ